MQIWRGEPDSDCGWSDAASCRWYGVGEPGKQSWPVPEAVAVKLMEMGAEVQRRMKSGIHIPTEANFVAKLNKATEQ